MAFTSVFTVVVVTFFLLLHESKGQQCLRSSTKQEQKVVNFGPEYSQLRHNKMATSQLLSVEFEVFGKVQGVFFRKHTMTKAGQLGLRGWCENTTKGTVLGVIEGKQLDINKMKLWLQTEGSPKSKISQTEFRNEKVLSGYTFRSFEIRK